MATPTVQPAFSAGEVGPALFGRIDIAKTHVGASTARNCFVSYRGGLYSRPGSAFVGYSKQTGRAYPPRPVTFQFSINQGLALEFGNFYMRVVFNGGLVTETQGFAVTGLSSASPAVINLVQTSSALTAAPNGGGVTASYNGGDTILLAGGAYSSEAQLTVSSTDIQSISVASPGGGYAPGDTIHLAGGNQIKQPSATVLTTQVVAATIVNGGFFASNGLQTLTGESGTGTKFQILGLVSGYTLVQVVSISNPGNYTVNPSSVDSMTSPAEGVNQASVRLTMGVLAASVATAGIFQSNPAGGTLTQASTSGSGSGVQFAGLFAPYAVAISQPGTYTTTPSNPVSQALSSGSGQGAVFTMSWQVGGALQSGDWVFLENIVGASALNGRTVVLQNVGGAQFAMFDPLGNPINGASFAYVSGGQANRIYTLATPWGEADLPWLKFTQSADTMSICCVNQSTLTEYPSYDLARVTDSNWTLTQLSTVPAVTPPASASASASSSGSIDYQYAVTSVAADGTESIASPIASANSAVNIASTAGSITITWAAVAGVNLYNIYKALPGYSAPPPPGSLFGFMGSAYGTQFQDTNIVADMTQVPPQHQNPFARGQVIGLNITAGGSNIATISYSITTLTGSGAAIELIIQSGVLVGYIVIDPGQNYAATDTIGFSVTGGGATTPSAGLTIGAQSGTYPSLPFYFQERRGYANTLNQPDTYFLSQPGSFSNFDQRTPTIDSDAITGTPWAQQVNGIQFAIPMPGGLVVLTGVAAWQLSGTGGAGSPVTPSSQQATPQAYNGCSPLIPPLRIENYIIYVQSKGSIYRLLSYNFFTNIYTGTDQTIYSPQLFTNYTIVSHAYCEEPFKVIWVVRNDGALLSNTFLPAQEINGWTRHDTQGLYQGVCSVTEPPVDALYSVVQRTINGQAAYLIERFDNRLWTTNENSWCVDAGLSLAQPTPAASLSASATTGALLGVTGLNGGKNYGAATYGVVADVGGQGSGATVALTIVGGVITAVAFPIGGAAYANPQISAYDPSGQGSGFSATCVVNDQTTLTAGAGVFSLANVGSIVRMNGGKAQITGYTSPTTVSATVLAPFISGVYPLQAAAGAWTMTAPTTTVSGLWHLAGAQVVGTADGAPFGPLTVSGSGSITLAQPASNIVVGLQFPVQIQTVYGQDNSGATTQGRRKKDPAMTARVELSYGFTMGSNQVDGSTLSPLQLAPPWFAMQAPSYQYSQPPYGSNTPPLYTGDVRLPIQGDWETPGQIALQQNLPLPLNVLAVIAEVWEADEPDQAAKPRAQHG